MAHRLRHCSSFMASSSPPSLNYLCQPLPIPLLEPPPPLIFPPHESFPSSLPASFQQYCPPHTSSQVTIAHDGGDPAANPNCWNNCQISLSKDGAACPVRQLSSLSSIIKSEVRDARSQFGAVHGPDVLLSNIQAGGFPFSDQASLIINPGAWAMGASNIASQPLDDQRVASTSRALQQTSMASLLFDSGFVERAARSSSLAGAEYASFPTSSAAMIPEDSNTNNLITTTINASDGFGKLHFVSSANASAQTNPRLQIASSDESGQSGHEVNNAISDSIPVQIRQESPLEHRSARQCGSASSSGELVVGTFPDTHGGGLGNAATSTRRKRLQENTNNMRHCSPTDNGDNKLLVGSSTKKHKASLVSSPKVTDQSLITAGEEEDKERISTASEGTSKIKDTIVSKDRTSCEAPKQDFIHVRARRGQATDSHSLAERVRREKISERMKFLQDLVPGCNKITGKAMMLDEIINYVKSLQNQVEFLSMKLASISPSMGLMGESVQYSTRHAEPEVMPLVGCEVLDKVRPMDDLNSHFDQSRQWRGRDLIGQNGKSAGAYNISHELSATEIHCSSTGFPLQLRPALNSYSHYDSKFLYSSEVE